jgi:hypothetical protein
MGFFGGVVRGGDSGEEDERDGKRGERDKERRIKWWEILYFSIKRRLG